MVSKVSIESIPNTDNIPESGAICATWRPPNAALTGSRSQLLESDESTPQASGFSIIRGAPKVRIGIGGEGLGGPTVRAGPVRACGGAVPENARRPIQRRDGRLLSPRNQNLG